MNEENKKTGNKSTLIIIVLAIVLIAVTLIAVKLFMTVKNNNQTGSVSKTISDTVEMKRYKNEEYYIIKGDYSGEYNLQFINLSKEYSSENDELNDFEKNEVMDYNSYKEYCEKWGLKQAYSDLSKKYIVFSYVTDSGQKLDARLAKVDYNEGDVDLYIWDDVSGSIEETSAYSIVIPAEKEIEDINIVRIYTEKEYDDIKKYGDQGGYDEKPVIYLYPTKQIKATVKLLNNNKITHSYPKYVNGWNVLANPNGDLVDLDTGRKLYSLYYESEIVEKLKVSNDGFVVKGEDVSKFLEEKLAVLGLTERESEEFIIYWLPRLESNKYNYIRFATNEEIEKNMPLDINPKPDTIIRVLMTYKGLEKPIKVEQQKLTTPKRVGFTVVEWGGTQIK